MPTKTPESQRIEPLYHDALDASAATTIVAVAVATFYLTAAALRPSLASLVIAQLVLATLALAGAALWLRPRVDGALGRALAHALALRRPAPTAMLGAVLIGASAWLPNLVLARWVAERLHHAPRVAGLERLLAGPTPALTIAALAVVPALCEELLFRGLWARALAPRVGRGLACILTALAFGAYHLSMVQLAPTALLGVVLAWASLRRGSLWLAVALHATNNAVASAVAAGLVGPVARGVALYPSLSLALAVSLSILGGLLLARPR